VANGKNETFTVCFQLFYSTVNLFVFALNSRRLYSIFVCFIYRLEGKNSKSGVIFAVYRLPSAVNVMLNLSYTNNACPNCVSF